jgi:hypothetical protein
MKIREKAIHIFCVIMFLSLVNQLYSASAKPPLHPRYPARRTEIGLNAQLNRVNPHTSQPTSEGRAPFVPNGERKVCTEKTMPSLPDRMPAALDFAHTDTCALPVSGSVFSTTSQPAKKLASCILCNPELTRCLQHELKLMTETLDFEYSMRFMTDIDFPVSSSDMDLLRGEEIGKNLSLLYCGGLAEQSENLDRDKDACTKKEDALIKIGFAVQVCSNLRRIFKGTVRLKEIGRLIKKGDVPLFKGLCAADEEESNSQIDLHG